MNEPSISLQSVNLHYASVAFKESSLKAFLLNNLFKRRQKSKENVEDIHALKNINLEISAGERVGLIGHNGAGKSTFLRTLAELYPVSGGSVHIKGRVRALFDLSLGFEPDATGRENILYRGLLLGLTPSFMREKESEIVEFADLGEFIDYPIKTYSAGMQVRLAFSISTTVGGDILLIDEVIGAGDASFISKSKKRIMRLIEEAKILVLASHDFSMLRSTCQRGLVFHKGKIVFDGPINQAVKQYQDNYIQREK